MKYTNYLLHSQFINIDELETDKFYLKPMSICFGISTTIVTFVFIGGFLPATLITDGLRQIKYKWHKNRHHRKNLVAFLHIW